MKAVIADYKALNKRNLPALGCWPEIELVVDDWQRDFLLRMNASMMLLVLRYVGLREVQCFSEQEDLHTELAHLMIIGLSFRLRANESLLAAPLYDPAGVSSIQIDSSIQIGPDELRRNLLARVGRVRTDLLMRCLNDSLPENASSKPLFLRAIQYCSASVVGRFSCEWDQAAEVAMFLAEGYSAKRLDVWKNNYSKLDMDHVSTVLYQLIKVADDMVLDALHKISATSYSYRVPFLVRQCVRLERWEVVFPLIHRLYLEGQTQLLEDILLGEVLLFPQHYSRLAGITSPILDVARAACRGEAKDIQIRDSATQHGREMQRRFKPWEIKSVEQLKFDIDVLFERLPVRASQHLINSSLMTMCRLKNLSAIRMLAPLAGDLLPAAKICAQYRNFTALNELCKFIKGETRALASYFIKHPSKLTPALVRWFLDKELWCARKVLPVAFETFPHECVEEIMQDLRVTPEHLSVLAESDVTFELILDAFK